MTSPARAAAIKLGRRLPPASRERIKNRYYETVVPIGRAITAPWRPEPNFFVIGTMKGGTSSLHQYLTGLPDVRMAFVKEVDYFDLNPDRGRLWYRSQFPFLGRNVDRCAVGDVTPYYLYHPYVAERVALAYPHAKIVVLLREPVRRAISHFVHMATSGRESATLLEAIHREMSAPPADPALLRNGGPELAASSHRLHSYVSRGLYAEQLDRWYASYPAESIHVTRSEDLFLQPLEAVSAVAQFLGVRPPDRSVEFPVVNEGARPDLVLQDSAAALSQLRDLFVEPNRILKERYGIAWEAAEGSL